MAGEIPDIGQPFIFVTLGTDRFRFDRLVGWIDEWLGDERGGKARVLVQCGSSTPPRLAEWTRFLTPTEMAVAYRSATAVVCHGAGPSVLEARAAGKIPIVVPRRREHREAVDDHQVAFSRRLSIEGAVREAESADQLKALLDEALADHARFETDPTRTDDDLLTVAERIGELCDRSVSLRSDADDIRVLFVAGAGRSGSTLLDRMLGQVPGLHSAGELVHIWQRGLVQDERCGCGERFSRCGFWQEVGRRAFGGWDAVDADRVWALKRSVDRHRFVPLMASLRVSPEYSRRLRDFGSVIRRLYAAIRDTSGRPVIVDSSKGFSYALLLSRVEGLDVRLVHLIRDSRGVAYSATKRVRRPETEEEAFMPRYPPARSAADWMFYNAAFEVLGSRGVPSIHLRYEDLLAEPARHVRRIVRFAGIDPRSISTAFLSDHTVHLSASHTVSGNPMRFKTGPVELQLDSEWHHAFPAKDRAVVSAITAPLRWHYGQRDERR